MATCFVIMGFGRKTDYGDIVRTLDLDATYESIIKPAVLANGLNCIRADEIAHSGVIDLPMYKMLLEADIVIADITTANPNALYELGVRHALRPCRTIIIKDIDGRFHFDLNHLVTLQYKHLGEDIGAREAREKSTTLENLIRAVMARTDVDSPVYTFLQTLRAPQVDQTGDPNMETVAASTETLGAAVEAGRRAMAESRVADAAAAFRRAYVLQPTRDPFILQQLALATYKAKLPTPESALRAAWGILSELRPDEVVDPETLGIAGAIRKRLWEIGGSQDDLEAAVEFYGRGFEVRRDYYNGENYAVCLDLRAGSRADSDDAWYDRRTADDVRKRIVSSLDRLLADPSASERSDFRWVLATQANVYRALGNDARADDYEQRFRALPVAQWEIDSFEGGKLRAVQAVTARS